MAGSATEPNGKDSRPHAPTCCNPYPLNQGGPSGNLLHHYGNSAFLMGKSSISMAIFTSYVKWPEGRSDVCGIFWLFMSQKSQHFNIFPRGFSPTIPCWGVELGLRWLRGVRESRAVEVAMRFHGNPGMLPAEMIRNTDQYAPILYYSNYSRPYLSCWSMFQMDYRWL